MIMSLSGLTGGWRQLQLPTSFTPQSLNHLACSQGNHYHFCIYHFVFVFLYIFVFCITKTKQNLKREDFCVLNVRNMQWEKKQNIVEKPLTTSGAADQTSAKIKIAFLSFFLVTISTWDQQLLKKPTNVMMWSIDVLDQGWPRWPCEHCHTMTNQIEDGD